jgi:CheY-like chemotaxis protein
VANERILVVDDDQVSLLVLQEFLAEDGFDLIARRDPEAAWELLIHEETRIDLVILDRVMPEFDGIELLHRMKADPRFADIPVIVQTAASSPEEVREGIAAGAYYYLTKPYALESLESIIRIALEESRGRFRLQDLAGHPDESQRLLSVTEYRFSSLADIDVLVPILAAMCPQPEVVAPGLADLMVNAVEHGNLAISYAEKSRLKWQGAWEKEIERRLQLPEFRERRASIRAERLATSIRFTVTDQGAGFDWQNYLAFDPARAFDPNGRGIALARQSNFASIEYQGRGNVVVATVSLSG